MDSSDAALLGVSGVVAAVVIGSALAAGALFGFNESVTRPFSLLAAEPIAWIVIAALVVAAVGNAYID
mgnify:CR=1 FL=1